MIKWFQAHFHDVLHHMNSLWFVVTAAIGSLVGLQAEERLPAGKAIIKFFTGFTTTIAIVLLIDHYFKPGTIALTSISYFMGLVGNKITFAFIDFVKRVIQNPRLMLNHIKDILTIINKIK